MKHHKITHIFKRLTNELRSLGVLKAAFNRTLLLEFRSQKKHPAIQTACIHLLSLFLALPGSLIIAQKSATHRCPSEITRSDSIDARNTAYKSVEVPSDRSFPTEEIGVPGSPESPQKPGSPSAPEEPRKSGLSSSDCEIGHWACEQECKKRYLTDATAPSFGAAQRAKVEYDFCQQACSKAFLCTPQPPVMPPER